MVGVAPLEIRKATKKDVPKVADMYDQLTQHVHQRKGNEQNLTKLIRTRIRRKDSTVYVATASEEIIGTATIILKSKTRAQLCDAYVIPEKRRKGLMKAMEKYIVGELRDKGVKSIELSVKSSNLEGSITWPNLGYEPHKIIMKKDL